MSGDNTHPALEVNPARDVDIWANVASMCLRKPDFIAVISVVPDGLFCFIWQIHQQHISALEVTDLSCGQVKTDRTTFTITRSAQL
ncbi:hypothetical protein [Acetobacter okinawensis]|uniref:hypothetical protein n=1 Tax=Acetobacter okinawensis TaxID=1076594 RepID=UPI001F5A6FB1|nr:hypothetical protein [Acetobacter okinawensis]